MAKAAVLGIRRWSLEEITNDLRKARQLDTKAERKAALEIVNRQDWRPSYEEVKEDLGIRDNKLTISDWVLKGRKRGDKDEC